MPTPKDHRALLEEFIALNIWIRQTSKDLDAANQDVRNKSDIVRNGAADKEKVNIWVEEEITRVAALEREIEQKAKRYEELEKLLKPEQKRGFCGWLKRHKS